VPVDVAVEASGGGGGSEVAARDRARSRQLLTQQTESIDELREEMAESGDASEWQQQFSLSRERNRLLRQLIESTEEGDFDRASRSGGKLLAGGGAALGAGAILGVGALSSVLSSFSWPQLPDLSIPEPPWDPIGVDEPSEVPVEDPDPAEVTEPDPVEVAEPDPAEYPVSDPDPAKYPVEEPEDAKVQEPDWKVQVEEPEPASEPASESASEGTGSAVDPKDAILGLGALGIGAGGAYALRNIGSVGSRVAAGAGAFLTPEMTGATDQEQFNQRRRTFNKRTPDWLQLPEMTGENKYPGSVFTAEGRQAQVEGVQELVNAINNFREDIRSSQEESSSTRSTEVTVESNVTVEGATSREVERATEEAKQQALREFNQQISRRR